MQETVQEIKDEIKITSPTEVTITEVNFNDGGSDAYKVDELLGDLLFFLRETKAMSTLMLCRQIESIEIKNGLAILSSENGDISELVSVEKHKVEIEKYFKKKGLGFKIKDKVIEKSKADLLKEFFGNKLIVE